MATDTKPKSRIDLLVEDQEYWRQKEKEFEDSIKHNSSTKDPKAIRLYAEEAKKKFRRLTEFLPRKKLDKATAELIREAELYLISAAKEEPDKNKKNETASKGGKPSEEKKTPVETMVAAIEKNKQAQIANGTRSSTPSESSLKNNPWAAFKNQREQGPTQTSSEPTKKPGRLKRFKTTLRNKISRGGNADRGRESRPGRIAALVNRFKRTPPKTTPVATMLSAIEKNKQAQAAKSALNPPTKTPQGAQQNNPWAAFKANMEHSKSATPPKSPAIIPSMRKNIPIIAGAQEGYDEVGYYEEQEIDDSGRGASVVGNRNAEPDKRESYSNASAPSNYAGSGGGGNSDDDQDDQQNNTGGDDNNRHSRGRRGKKAKRKPPMPDWIKNPLIKPSGLSQTLIQRAGAALFAIGPVGWGIIIFIIVLLLIIFAITGDAEEKRASGGACRGGVQESLIVTKTKTGEPTARAGEDLTYEIKISDTKNNQGLTVVDRLPAEVSIDPAAISSTWPGYTLDAAQRTITWTATPQRLPPGGTLSPTNITFTVTLRLNPGVDNVHVINRVDVTAVGGGVTLSGIPSHGAFSVHTPAEVDQAAALGVRYIIPYGWGTFAQNVNPVDPNGPMGQALQRNNMRAVVDVTNLSFDITPDRTAIGSYIYTCQAGAVVANLNHVTSIVNQAKDSPLTMGYWAKDDDVQGCGSMKNATKQVYDHIKSLDPNPEHYVIMGYGDINSVQAHYQAGVADAVAFYPYPEYLGENAVDNVMGMVSHVRPLSPDIKIIGIYQAFANEPSLPAYVTTKRTIPVRPAASVKSDAEKFLNQGAQSLVAFGWNAQDIHQGPGNVTGISDAVREANTVAGTAAPGAGGAGVCDPGAPSTYSGKNVPPSDDDCHGLYRGYMNQLARIGKSNYGDPKCELAKQDPNGRWFIDKDRILSFMRDDPQGPKLPAREAEGVFLCIIPKECSYNVNAFNPNSTSTSRGTPGAFGCFQMNATGFSNSGQPEDVGDVVWQMQVHNANNWRNAHNGGKWSNYWPQSYAGCLNEYGL